MEVKGIKLQMDYVNASKDFNNSTHSLNSFKNSFPPSKVDNYQQDLDPNYNRVQEVLVREALTKNQMELQGKLAINQFTLMIKEQVGLFPERKDYDLIVDWFRDLENVHQFCLDSKLITDQEELIFMTAIKTKITARTADIFRPFQRLINPKLYPNPIRETLANLKIFIFNFTWMKNAASMDYNRFIDFRCLRFDEDGVRAFGEKLKIKFDALKKEVCLPFVFQETYLRGIQNSSWLVLQVKEGIKEELAGTDSHWLDPEELIEMGVKEMISIDRQLEAHNSKASTDSRNWYSEKNKRTVAIQGVGIGGDVQKELEGQEWEEKAQDIKGIDFQVVEGQKYEIVKQIPEKWARGTGALDEPGRAWFEGKMACKRCRALEHNWNFCYFNQKRVVIFNKENVLDRYIEKSSRNFFSLLNESEVPSSSNSLKPNKNLTSSPSMLPESISTITTNQLKNQPKSKVNENKKLSIPANRLNNNSSTPSTLSITAPLPLISLVENSNVKNQTNLNVKIINSQNKIFSSSVITTGPTSPLPHSSDLSELDDLPPLLSLKTLENPKDPIQSHNSDRNNLHVVKTYKPHQPDYSSRFLDLFFLFNQLLFVKDLMSFFIN